MKRRDFIQTSAVAGLALSVPHIVLAQADKTYRVALVGSGWWGMLILRTAM